MKRVFARARSATRDARIGRRVAEEEGRRVSRGRGGAEPRGAVAGKARARESSGGAARDVRADRGARASSRRRSRMCRAIAIRGARTLTTSAVRAAVALRAATRATGATTRRAETVAAIVAGCVCDANVRCGVPRGDAPSRNPKTRPGTTAGQSHVFPVARTANRWINAAHCWLANVAERKNARLNTHTRRQIYIRIDNCHVDRDETRWTR